MAREKVSFTMEAATKTKLEALKARLRREGLARSVASESAIIESLIRRADLPTLLNDLGRRQA
jgi:hypothetical protein